MRKRSLTYDTILEGSAGIANARPATACVESHSSLAQEPLKPALKTNSPRTNTGNSSPVADKAPWKGLAPESEIRDSIKSGWSLRSSGIESTRTKNSSVFTKMGSVRDSATTAEMSDVEFSNGATVGDEATDVHSQGADEESNAPHRIRMSFLHGHEISLRSSRIAEAMNEDISPLPVQRPTRIDHTKSKPSTASESLQTAFSRPPQLREPSETHDQYGFRKATREVSELSYNAWHREYAKAQNRRTSRWVSFMKNSELPTNDPTRFPFRSEKVQRYVRKGMPPMWRGAMWFFYAGGQSYLDKFPDLYARLIAEAEAPRLSSNDKEAIDRDLNRTYPDNIHFKPDPPIPEGQETPLMSSLRRLLYAFAMHHPRIGYCQSLNFLAGMLLLFLDEEKAFWMLHIITARYLPGTHEISLEGANVDLWVLMLALKEEQPKVWTRIGGEKTINPAKLPPVSLCTTPWFMSLFIGTLPVESVLRVWDMLFYDGSTVIFRAALAIFRMGEPDIVRVQDPMEIFQVVQTVPRRMLDAVSLVAVANRKGCIGSAWIEQRRRERKDWYAQERAAEQARRQSRELATADGTGAIPPPLAAGSAVMGSLAAARSAADLTRPVSRGKLQKKPSKATLAKRPPARKS